MKASADESQSPTVQNCSSKQSVRPINNVEDEGEAGEADADMEDMRIEELLIMDEEEKQREQEAEIRREIIATNSEIRRE